MYSQKHHIYQLARSLRKKQTAAESFFWQKVRNRSFQGLKFTRQFVVEHAEVLGQKSYYIADFHCHAKKLIIEIDGDIHDQQKDYDQMREEGLKGMGFNVLRFTNEQILFHWNEVEKELLNFIEHYQK
ncbi:MAG: endonuclease domain-containing protein [Bacteroidetes bacterium]|nr:endonuclease domain-containing protein [Bacteroidota bacterium]